MRSQLFAGLVLMTAALLGSSSASASSGTIGGSFFFTQLQGNCGNATSGNKFPCAQVNTAQPVQNAEVWVTRVSDGAVVGMNFSDDNGNFSVSWNDPNAGAGNSTLRVAWRSRVQGNRFEVGTGGTGNNWYFWISGGSGEAQWTGVANGNTNIGSHNWGGNPHINVYDGANKFLKTMLVSNRMNAFLGAATPKCMSGFTCSSRTVVMVDSLGNGNATFGACTNSNAYADPRDNYLCLSNDNVGHFANLSRVMHEFGHIAEYVSNRDQQRGNSADYRRDDPPACSSPTPPASGCNEHTLTSQEFASAAWQEGVATHFAHVTLYDPGAPNPFTCVSTSACNTVGTNVESSTTDCTNAPRSELAVQRYLWDTYDSVVDTRVLGVDTWTDDLSRGVWEVCDTIHAFNPGTGGAQRDEAPSDRNGRSSRDFNHNWWVWGTDSWHQYNMNCHNPDTDI